MRLRIEDLIDALSSPAGNERLEFARVVAGRQSIDFAATDARRRLREWLAAGTARVIAEYGRQADLVRERAVSDASRSTLFRDRGLSSDTSIYPGFGVEQALAVLLTNRLLAAGGVRRVGVVGPGLDFVDKRQGTDFYPVQTIQPFAVVDSVLRLGLAEPGQVRVTTFDVSPRVNHHLEVARRRAEAGEAYVLNLPRRLDLFPWSRYWWLTGSSSAIGSGRRSTGRRPARDRRPRPDAGGAYRPDVVQAIAPEDLDIVLQRMEPLAAGDRFDLIVATNVLVYYDVFEQSLALANVAAMLRPGGVFLSNQAVEPLGGIPMESLGHVDIPMEDLNGGICKWYEEENMYFGSEVGREVCYRVFPVRGLIRPRLGRGVGEEVGGYRNRGGDDTTSVVRPAAARAGCGSSSTLRMTAAVSG